MYVDRTLGRDPQRLGSLDRCPCRHTLTSIVGTEDYRCLTFVRVQEVLVLPIRVTPKTCGPLCCVVAFFLFDVNYIVCLVVVSLGLCVCTVTPCLLPRAHIVLPRLRPSRAHIVLPRLHPSRTHIVLPRLRPCRTCVALFRLPVPRPRLHFLCFLPERTLSRFRSLPSTTGFLPVTLGSHWKKEVV